MINFDLLKKDDYESLFEGFETSFLQIPFKRPTKSLNHYIPNGFRVDKLKRNQMIKVFSDAMIDREPSICGFVSEEIERQFEKAGIFEQVKSLDNSTNSTDRILKISALLWANHLRIPAYLVLLLCGVSCSDDDKTSSIILNKSHTSELDEISKIQYEVGYSHSKAESLEELNTEKKLAEKLERNLLHLKTHIDDIESQKSKTLEDLDSALSVIETLRKQISEDKDNADSLDKQVFRLTNEVSRSNDIIRRQKDDIQDLEKRLQLVVEKDAEIFELQQKLSNALNHTYSDDVIKRVCSGVLDELTASSPGKAELLRIAKNKFSEEDTVRSGWEKLSCESNGLIESIIMNFDKHNFNESQLDQLEILEDGILIRYAVVKALKSVLFNELETAEVDSSISSRFSGEVNTCGSEQS